MNRYDLQLARPSLRISLPHRKDAYYFHTFARGRAVGYYRPRTPPGYWHARIRSGYKTYRYECLGIADDVASANGKNILTFKQALARAEAWCQDPARSISSPDPRPVGPVSELIACPVGPIYTVGHALSEYVEWKRTFAAESTFRALLPVLNLYVYPRLGTIAADDLTANDIRELMEHVVATPTVAYMRRWGTTFDPSRMDPETRRRRRYTANHVLAILKGALNLAWEQGKIRDDRAWRRVPNFNGVRRTRIELLTRTECRNLIMAAEPEIRTLILGLLYTGCRIAELLNLRAEDVSRLRMAVYVRKSKFHSTRHIALPEEGYRFFRQRAFRKARSTPLFLRPDGGPWTKHFLDKGLNRALARAGLPRSIVYHTLRHTYASLRLLEGVSPIAVARQMGHKDVRTVLQIYAHCTDDFIDEEIRKRFEPILEGDDELAAVIANESSPLTFTTAASRPRQAALPRRMAR